MAIERENKTFSLCRRAIEDTSGRLVPKTTRNPAEEEDFKYSSSGAQSSCEEVCEQSNVNQNQGYSFDHPVTSGTLKNMLEGKRKLSQVQRCQ
ncbi:hypothetical protein RUM43_003305 [Polyplax serrata]|uniref:Uncharacterized protein n=1 Tax=Polyplax serrata TaxID=468196 RepID=A0AAN8PEC2_POLSC